MNGVPASRFGLFLYGFMRFLSGRLGVIHYGQPPMQMSQENTPNCGWFAIHTLGHLHPVLPVPTVDPHLAMEIEKKTLQVGRRSQGFLIKFGDIPFPAEHQRVTAITASLSSPLSTWLLTMVIGVSSLTLEAVAVLLWVPS